MIAGGYWSFNMELTAQASSAASTGTWTRNTVFARRHQVDCFSSTNAARFRSSNLNSVRPYRRVSMRLIARNTPETPTVVRPDLQVFAHDDADGYVCRSGKYR